MPQNCSRDRFQKLVIRQILQEAMKFLTQTYGYFQQGLPKMTIFPIRPAIILNELPHDLKQKKYTKHERNCANLDRAAPKIPHILQNMNVNNVLHVTLAYEEKY